MYIHLGDVAGQLANKKASIYAGLWKVLNFIGN